MDQLDNETVKLMQVSKDPYMRVLASLALLKAERGTQYNSSGVKLEDYFPLGRASYVQMCHVKTLRLRSTMDGRDVDFRDSAIDLANYAIFAVMFEAAKGNT